jgi:hypothetical protein
MDFLAVVFPLFLPPSRMHLLERYYNIAGRFLYYVALVVQRPSIVATYYKVE